MKTTQFITPLKSRFPANKTISTNELIAFFRAHEPNLSRKTCFKRISMLKKQGVLQQSGRGNYCFGKKSAYKPIYESDILELFHIVKAKYPLLKICVWNTRQINEFMVHQPGYFSTMVEIEKDGAEYVFNFLHGKYANVFFNPSQKEVEKYILATHNCIIVKDLISEAPMQQIQGISTATLEKILVDLFCDADLFVAQQGAELGTIFTTAYEKYSINLSKMQRYATRRRRQQTINEYLTYLQNTEY